jgi:hypothetical protein
MKKIVLILTLLLAMALVARADDHVGKVCTIETGSFFVNKDDCIAALTQPDREVLYRKIVEGDILERTNAEVRVEDSFLVKLSYRKIIRVYKVRLYGDPTFYYTFNQFWECR